jgi:hypothetical protein
MGGTPSVPSGTAPDGNLRRRRRLPPVRNGEKLARDQAKRRRKQWREALLQRGGSQAREVAKARGLNPAAPAWFPAGASVLNPYAQEWYPGQPTGPGGQGGWQHPSQGQRPRERTAGEQALLGLSLRAGPGGCNGCSDPRRFPPTFCRGNYTVALINPTSVNRHIGAIKSLPADVVALAETALTEGGQKQAAIELAAGDSLGSPQGGKKGDW